MRTPVMGPSEIPVLHRPEWIKVRALGGATYKWRFGLMRSRALHTACFWTIPKGIDAVAKDELVGRSAEAMTRHTEVLRWVV